MLLKQFLKLAEYQRSIYPYDHDTDDEVFFIVHEKSW